MLFQYTCKVSDVAVELYVTDCGSVNVRVDGYFGYSGDIPPRVGAVIIKKCRKAFFDWWWTAPIQVVECTPYLSDGKVDFRRKVFEKCGFKSHNGYFYTLTKPRYTWRIQYYKTTFEYVDH